MATAVNERSATVEALGCDWPMLEALMGGTRKMRAAGEKFLPEWPGEDPTAYKKRLAVSTLFPAYRRTVSVMAGKPFSTPLTLSEDTPVEIAGIYDADGAKTQEGWADDIDREGVNLHTFAAEMFRESFYGLCGILVDYPPVTKGPRPLTRQEERDGGLRPYFVRVMHNQLLGWKLSTELGPRKLTQLRIQVNTTVDDGEFGEKALERVLVLEIGKWRLFEKRRVGKTDSWVQAKDGVTSLNYIPFVPIYGQRQGYMQGVCPLIDLAYKNVKHWQSQSDQDNILHVARVPILFAKGLGDNPIAVGAGTAVKADNAEYADLKFVEHSGAAIEAGANSLNDLEDQMIQAGAELLVKKDGSRTATESANDAEGNKTDLLRMVEGFEDSINLALYYLADYAKLGSGGKVKLFKDFTVSTLDQASGQLILTMQQGGLISKRRAISELKRRGELVPETDPDDEADEIASEGPTLGTITDNDAPPPKDEEPEAEAA